MALLDQHSLVGLEQVELADQPHQPPGVLPVCDGQHAVSAGDHPVGDLTQGLIGKGDHRLACELAGFDRAGGLVRGEHIGECQHTNEALVGVEHGI